MDFLEDIFDRNHRHGGDKHYYDSYSDYNRYKDMQWQCNKGNCKKITSPTNIKLERVICAGDGNVYAVGQVGTILYGRNGRWKVLAHNATTEQFWGATWFNDRLWVATSDSVYEVSKDKVVTKVNIAQGKITCGWLDSGFGVMWSVGHKYLYRTTDGFKWEIVPLE